MKKLIVVFYLLLVIPILEAAVEVKPFENPEYEQRYKNLINEFRCVVCQNQNIADSNAALAKDLRKQVFNMINAGKSDEEIMMFMVTRYGDFVLYRPQFNSTTFFLWVGPFIIFVVGLYFLINFIRRRKEVVVTELSQKEKEKINKLLDEKEQKQ